MAFLDQHKNMDNFLEALLKEHGHYLPIIEYLDSVMQNASELSWSECERIGLELGKQNGSEFCAGIRVGMIEALDNDTPNNDKFEAILAFAKKAQHGFKHDYTRRYTDR